MSSITLHNLDNILEKKIREKAKAEHTSLNKTIQKLLREALHLEKETVKRGDFSDLAGTMSAEEARTFEEDTGIFSKIDRDLWT